MRPAPRADLGRGHGAGGSRNLRRDAARARGLRRGSELERVEDPESQKEAEGQPADEINQVLALQRIDLEGFTLAEGVGSVKEAGSASAPG